MVIMAGVARQIGLEPISESRQAANRSLLQAAPASHLCYPTAPPLSTYLPALLLLYRKVSRRP